MKSAEVRWRYLEFFKNRGHVVIPSAPLVPENDPTTLFTGSGMQPMLPYLLGQPNPVGSRLVDSQKCFRAQDIEEVGDNRHTTFFEMLGNWSLGDYFKKEQINWIFEFLTSKDVGLSLDPHKLYVSVFRGKPEIKIPADEDAVKLWQAEFAKYNVEAKTIDFAERNGMGDGRIFYYDESKNWWSRVGSTGNMPVGEPGGPDSEVFYDFGAERKLHETSIYKDSPCHVNCDCGRFMEICNNVFMTYKRTDKGFEPLTKKNIDFGGGLERLVAVSENDPDVFSTDLFSGIITEIEKYSDVHYQDKANKASIRVIVDHFKAAIFLVVDGVQPGNKDRPYVLRRLIRRSVVKMIQLNIERLKVLPKLCESVLKIYSDTPYFDKVKQHDLEVILGEEINKFEHTLHKSTKMLQTSEVITADLLFDLKQTYGLPPEVALELLNEWGRVIDVDEINKTLLNLENKHKELSRTASKGMFKGGLADQSKETTKLHTATHLLHEALHRILGEHVSQKGSNITAERLRFDFSHPTKLKTEELKQIEDLVNEKIKENLPVSFEIIDKDEAMKSGARAFFGERYGDKVKVYRMGDFSREICGGPHVSFTGVLRSFTIIKEESAGSGIRRIYAVLPKA